MEVVVPGNGQIPYLPGVQFHSPIPYADKVFETIEKKKIRKYGFVHSTPIDLLIYITHEQYAPNGAAIQVLRSYFRDRQHPFEYVFFIVPIAEYLTPISLVFSRDYQFSLPSLAELARRSWFNIPCAGH